MQSSIYVKKNIFTPVLFFLFIFLVASNLMGMVPYTITLTSHLSFTFFLSLTFFIGHLLIGSKVNGSAIFGLFLPEGVPLLLVPLLIIIEYLSYFARALSLAIRLFANMVSGHVLLKILFGFFVKTLGTLDFYSKFLNKAVFYPVVSKPITLVTPRFDHRFTVDPYFT
jgi:ATP synthase subunit 6